MMSSTTPNLKILVIGPSRVGKTTIANAISEFQTIIPTEYKPTKSLRILECEKEFSDDQINNNKYLKSMNAYKCKIQLWDTTGDRR